MDAGIILGVALFLGGVTLYGCAVAALWVRTRRRTRQRREGVA